MGAVLSLSQRRKDEQSVLPDNSNAWKAERFLAVPVRDQLCNGQRVRSAEGHPELGGDDQADDALPQRGRIGGEPTHIQCYMTVIGLADEFERPIERQTVK